MNSLRFARLHLLFTLAVCLGCALPLLAEHRATRLGHPSTRFAPPLTTEQQLRDVLTNQTYQADVQAILDQAGWKGSIEDLRRAAATAEVSEVKLPKGTRLPFMSARKDGRPIALMDVLWVGDEPIDAYEFFFASAGRRYRCVTPKACSNFLVIDLGPDQPALTLVKTAPAETSRCATVPVRLTVRNTCTLTLTGVHLTDVLPGGWKTTDGETALNLELGTLAPGAGKEVSFRAQPAANGVFTNRAEVTSLEGARAHASTITAVRAPVLAVECRAPAQVLLGRPAEVCLDVRNNGDALESGPRLTLAVPPGAVVTGTTTGGAVGEGRLVWELPTLLPGETQRVCAVFTLAQPGALPLVATASGACAATVETRCATRVAGVQGVLVEVVDLADPIETGNPVTYEIRVTNQGLLPLTGCRVLCTVPDEQEFVSGTGATAVSAAVRNVTMAVLPVLAPKSVATWQVTTKALKTGDARFKVAFSSEQFERPIDEDESTTHY